MRFDYEAGQLVEVATGRVLVPHVACANTLWKQTVGLIGTKQLDLGQGVWFPHCGAVHTFGMRFSLDILFLNKAGVVIGLAHSVRPFRVALRWGARMVVELPAGTLAATEVTIGQTCRLLAVQ